MAILSDDQISATTDIGWDIERDEFCHTYHFPALAKVLNKEIFLQC
jgi:hypothetical protein